MWRGPKALVHWSFEGMVGIKEVGDSVTKSESSGKKVSLLLKSKLETSPVGFKVENSVSGVGT